MTDQGDINRMRRIGQRIESYGVEVHWMPGWEERGGTWARVPVGVIDHHDAASLMTGEWGVLGYIVSAQLAQFQVGRCLDGKPRVAICAAGRQGHAGKGGWTFPGGPRIPTNDGNQWLYGVEKANNGLGESYTDAAIYAADATFHAILTECGVPLDRVVGHKEYGNTPPGGWAGRKTDPQYSMEWRRNRVVNFTPGNSPAQEEDDMPSAQEIANAVLDTPVDTPEEARKIGFGPTVTLRAMLQWMDYNFRVVIPNAIAAHDDLQRLINTAADRVRDDVRADLAAGYGLKLEPKESETPDPQ